MHPVSLYLYYLFAVLQRCRTDTKKTINTLHKEIIDSRLGPVRNSRSHDETRTTVPGNSRVQPVQQLVRPAAQQA